MATKYTQQNTNLTSDSSNLDSKINEESNLQPIDFQEYFDDSRPLKTGILSEMVKDKGKIWVDNEADPTLILYTSKPFAAIYGEITHSKADLMLEQIPIHHMIIPPSVEWKEKMHQYYGFSFLSFDNERFRFSTKSLSIEHLESLKQSLMQKRDYIGFNFEKLTTELLHGMSEYLQKHFEPFGDIENLVKDGFAFVAYDTNNTILSIAGTAHKPYNREFEVQVVTDKDARRKGLAMMVSIELIIYSLKEGYVPIWDAANENSKAMAEKLGYTFLGSYDVFLRTKPIVKILIKLGFIKFVNFLVQIMRKFKKKIKR